jgi:hypothetical protein
MVLFLYLVDLDPQTQSDPEMKRSENLVEKTTTRQDGMAYFNGPWFVLPIEVPPQPGRMYYKSEAFLSSIRYTKLSSFPLLFRKIIFSIPL